MVWAIEAHAQPVGISDGVNGAQFLIEREISAS